MDDLIKKSHSIIQEAIRDHEPYAVVLMMSGGHDSLLAYQISRLLKVPLTHLMHGVTGTGIHETTLFVRRLAETSGLVYLEADAKDNYDKYVLRKGFFGIGEIAHTYAYHVLKHQVFSTTLSKYIRKRRRGRSILLLNGARLKESKRRERTMKAGPIRRDTQTKSNIWVNVVHDWSAVARNDFLSDFDRNPVYDILHRSGECLCGTMQYPFSEVRREVSYWYPDWGDRIDKLECEAARRGFCWKWGEDMPKYIKDLKKLKKEIDSGQGFLPLCQGCVRGLNDNA